MSTNTSKKLTGSILTVILLAVCLCISTFALIFSMVSVENNLFHTGTIDINLNDGKPIITADEFLFEPGMTVKKISLLKTMAHGTFITNCTLKM